MWNGGMGGWGNRWVGNMGMGFGWEVGFLGVSLKKVFGDMNYQSHKIYQSYEGAQATMV